MRRLIKKSPKLLSASGFTLIELLLVIVIIGILSGIVIAVINPAQTRTRANETILKGNTDKLCYAMFACATSRTAPLTQCNSPGGVEATPPNGTPPTATYNVQEAGGTLSAFGTLGACTYTCTYVVSTGVSTPATANAGCMVL